MDVPLRERLAVSLVMPADMMLLPGAQIWTHVP
jgi:hypothetical protein